MWKWSDVSRETFIKAISTDPADKFAKTFMSKSDMQDIWGRCIGAFAPDGSLGGAIITTISERKPHVANLQLLHTFAAHRKQGVAKKLCQLSLSSSILEGAKYFRVSSEPESVEFYKRIGFQFWGKQKSGCQLSIFRIVDSEFRHGDYDYRDPVIYAAVNRKGKGGCVELFDLTKSPDFLSELCD